LGSSFVGCSDCSLVSAGAAKMNSMGLYGELAVTTIELDLDDGTQNKAGCKVNGVLRHCGSAIPPHVGPAQA
jgi:hypothetical protein